MPVVLLSFVLGSEVIFQLSSFYCKIPTSRGQVLGISTVCERASERKEVGCSART